ncbi:MAG: cytochrome c3 family protein, partial [Gammaproteobacteria bacterium]
MPGPLIEGHAKIEATCEECHSSFEKKELSKNCLNCHEDIAKDRKQQQGYHGISPSATASPCQSCHTDHEGRDADIIGLDP